MALLIAFGVTAALIQAPSAASTASVSGRVVEDGSGAPIEGAQVTVMQVRSGPVVISGADLPPGSRTDRNGQFQIRGLEPGRYRVAVQKSGYAFPFGSSSSSSVTSIEIAAGQDRVVNLSLQRGAVIVGRVVNEAGEPLVGLRIMAMTSRQALGSPRAIASPGVGLIPTGPGAQTNDLGEFRVYGLPPGEYFVQASPGPELGRSVAQSARMLVPTYFPDTTDPTGAQPINLGTGQTFDSIVIKMVEAPAFQVSGVVVDESGRPVANAVVKLDSEMPVFAFGGHLTTHSNAAGAFTIRNVTSATYTLVAIAPLVISNGANSGGSGGVGAISFGSGSAPFRGGIITESRNGVTTQYRDEFATRATVSVHQSDVNGLQVIVQLPQK